MTSCEKQWTDWRGAMLAGQYFEAHDALEALWRISHDGRQQALIWVAAAFYHWRQANRIGADRLLRKVLARMESLEATPALKTLLQAWIEEIVLKAPCPGVSATALDALLLWARSRS